MNIKKTLINHFYRFVSSSDLVAKCSCTFVRSAFSLGLPATELAKNDFALSGKSVLSVDRFVRPRCGMPASVKKDPAGQADRARKKENEICWTYRLIVSSSSNMESAVVMIFDAAE